MKRVGRRVRAPPWRSGTLSDRSCRDPRVLTRTCRSATTRALTLHEPPKAHTVHATHQSHAVLPLQAAAAVRAGVPRGELVLRERFIRKWRAAVRTWLCERRVQSDAARDAPRSTFQFQHQPRTCSVRISDGSVSCGCGFAIVDAPAGCGNVGQHTDVSTFTAKSGPGDAATATAVGAEGGAVAAGVLSSAISALTAVAAATAVDATAPAGAATAAAAVASAAAAAALRWAANCADIATDTVTSFIMPSSRDVGKLSVLRRKAAFGWGDQHGRIRTRNRPVDHNNAYPQTHAHSSRTHQPALRHHPPPTARPPAPTHFNFAMRCRSPSSAIAFCACDSSRPTIAARRRS